MTTDEQTRVDQIAAMWARVRRSGFTTGLTLGIAIGKYQHSDANFDEWADQAIELATEKEA